MFKHSFAKKFISISLVLFMLTAAFAIQISASDYEDDWSKGVVESFIQRKIITSDADGNVRPNDIITRAETIALINKAFNFTKTASISYSDVSGSDSFYKDVQIAEAMGYMPNSGKSSEFRPDSELTREEMAIILMRVLELLPKPTSANKYSDVSSMSSEGKGAIGALVDSTVQIADSLGDEDYFYPQDELKRNIAFGLVYKAESYYDALRAGKKQFATVNVHADSTLGDNSGNVQNYHNVTVLGKDSKIENIVIWGNLVINSDVGSGNVTLKNVTVKGGVFVYGGGSVKFTDTSIKFLTVNKSNNNISIDMLGSSDIDELIIKSGVDFTANSNTLSAVTLTTDISKGASVSVTADTVKDFTVKAADVKLAISVAQVGELTMTRTSSGAVVDIAKGTTVAKATVSSVCTLKGAGTLTSSTINVSGATVSTSIKNPSKSSSSSVSSSSSNSSSGSSVTYYSNSSSYYNNSSYYSSYSNFATWFYSQYGYTPSYEQYYNYVNNNGYYNNGYYNNGYYYNGYYYPSFNDYTSWFYASTGYNPTWSDYSQYIYNNYGFYPDSNYSNNNGYYWNGYNNTVSTISDLKNALSYGATYIVLTTNNTVSLDSYVTIPSNCTLVVSSGTALTVTTGGTLKIDGAVSGSVTTSGSGIITGSGTLNSNYIPYYNTKTVYNESDLYSALNNINVTNITIATGSNFSLTYITNIPSGKVITNNGTLYISYSLTNSGTITNYGTIYNSGTLTNYGVINNNGSFYNRTSSSARVDTYYTSGWTGSQPMNY